MITNRYEYTNATNLMIANLVTNIRMLLIKYELFQSTH